MNEWTEVDTAKLRELAGTMPAAKIAAILGKTKMAVLGKIARLKIKGYTHGCPHSWTEKQFKMLRNVKPGISSVQFAAQIGKGDEAVRYWARKFGITFVPPREWTESELDALRAMHGRLTLSQAAAELGRTVRAVRAKKTALGITMARHIRPRKVKPPRQKKPKVQRPVANPAPCLVPKRAVRRRDEVSAIEWCPQCSSPVSNWSEHYGRMGHRRPAA